MILGILQARCSSTRFPGKVLAPLHGRPMILCQIERLRRARTLDRIVVATSVESSDDQLVELLAKEGVEVRRGPLDDVLTRFALVVDELRPDHIVRLTADCPLTDPGVIDLIVEDHLASGRDYTSNVRPPTFPHGFDAECLTADAFGRLRVLELTAREREHVTLGLAERPEEFSIGNVVQAPDRSALRWTVDVPADLDFVRQVYDALYDADPAFGQDDVLALLTSGVVVGRTADDLGRNTWMLEPE